MDYINAVYCKTTNEILYSRSRHDCRRSEDGKISIDGGFDYIKINGDLDNIIPLRLNVTKLLKQIFYYDYNYGNSLAKNFEEGYHGRFKITYSSNLKFYRDLIVNFEDVKEIIENIIQK